jgi:hypothetical protein
MEFLPQTITFALFEHELPDLTLTVGRKGGVRERQPFYETEHVNVLVVQLDDEIDVTNSQHRAIKQIILAGMFTNPCVTVAFMPGSSPWGCYILKDGYAQMTFREATQMQAVHIRKFAMRKWARDRIIMGGKPTPPCGIENVIHLPIRD